MFPWKLISAQNYIRNFFLVFFFDSCFDAEHVFKYIF